MDLYCPTCGEPWDNDSLHEEAEARKASQDAAPAGTTFTLGTTYTAVAADFRRKGCKALINAFGPQRQCEPNGSTQAQAAALVYELSGDDMDGAMSDMDDFGGLFG
jgi:hypothetical protein